MELAELLERIRSEKKKKILVFGPPRSGTTITAHILQKETGFELIPEAEALPLDPLKRKELFKSRRSFIFHANNALRYFATEATEDMICVLVRRNKEAVIKSAKKFSKFELFNHYYRHFGRSDNYYDNYWTACNKWLSDNPDQKILCVLDYKTLKKHAMWIDAKHRKQFRIKQVQCKKLAQLRKVKQAQKKHKRWRPR